MRNPKFFVLALLALAGLWSCRPQPLSPQACVPIPRVEVPGELPDSVTRQLQWLNELHEFVENHIQDPLPQDTVAQLRQFRKQLIAMGSGIPPVFIARACRLEAIHLQNEYRWNESRDVLLASADRLEGIEQLLPTEAYELGYHYNLLALAGMEVFRPEEALLYGERALGINRRYGFTTEALKDLVNLELTKTVLGQPRDQDEVFHQAKRMLRQSVDCLQSSSDSSVVASIEYNHARQLYMQAHQRLYAGAQREAHGLAQRAARQWKTADSLLRAFGLVEQPAYRLVMSELASSLAADFPTLGVQQPEMVDSSVYWARNLPLPEQHPAWIILHAISVNGAYAYAQSRRSCLLDEDAQAVERAREYVEDLVFAEIPVSFRRGSMLLRRRLALLDRYCGQLMQDTLRLADARAMSRAVMEDYHGFMLDRATEAQLEFSAGDFYGFYSDILRAMEGPGYGNGPEALIVSDRTKSLALRLAFEKRKSVFVHATPEQQLLLNRERELAAAVRTARLTTSPSQLSRANTNYEAFLDSLIEWGSPSGRRLYQDFRSVEPLSIRRVQRELLTPDHAAIDLFYAKGEIVIHAVTQNDWARFAVPVTDTLLEALEYAYSAELTGMQTLQRAHRIYADLFDVPLSWLAERGNTKTIILATDHRLPGLDIGVLPLTPPKPGKTWNEHHLLYDDYNVVYAYSLSSLLAARSLATVRIESPDRWGVFAATQGGKGDRNDSYPPLPHLSQAIRTIQSAYHGNSLDRTYIEAERDEVLRQADRYRYLMLVAHGFTDKYLPERYYLQFSGPESEVLTTYDLYDLSLGADLTMALNCESAEGMATNFSGKKSIARALSYAGSRGVIAGRGVLPDLHTAEIVESFMTGFIDRRLTAAEALHEAKMTYRKQHPELGPFAWSGLVYYGDPDVRYSVGIGERISGISR